MECRNCQHQIAESDNYCLKCGAKVIRNRLTLRNLWDDFSEQFLNYDNKLLKTYIGIFTKPEVIIGSYVNGTRKKYVNVLSYFALALTLSGIQIFILRKFYMESMDVSIFLPENAPESSADVNWVYDYLSIIALINLPIYGLIAWLAFIGLKKFNYTEHLVIMTYIVAQFSITNALVLTSIIAIFGANFYLIGNISNLIVMIFTAYCYKKLYPLTLSATILRTFLFFGILIVLLILVGIIQFLVMVINAGGIEEMIQQQRAQQGITYIASSAMNWIS